MVNGEWSMVNGESFVACCLSAHFVSFSLFAFRGSALSGTYNLNFSIYDNVTVGNLMWNSGNVSVEGVGL